MWYNSNVVLFIVIERMHFVNLTWCGVVWCDGHSTGVQIVCVYRISGIGDTMEMSINSWYSRYAVNIGYLFTCDENIRNLSNFFSLTSMAFIIYFINKTFKYMMDNSWYLNRRSFKIECTFAVCSFYPVHEWAWWLDNSIIFRVVLRIGTIHM